MSTGRRELTLAVVGSAVAGGLALVAGGQDWGRVTAERGAPLPPVQVALTGSDAAPLVPAAGLVLLAAAVALLAVRGAGGWRSGCWWRPPGACSAGRGCVPWPAA